MKTAAFVISKFGGISALSKALGHKNPTTVQGWKERGVIPARQQGVVLEAARANDIDLLPEDFFKNADGATDATGEAANASAS